MTDTRPDATAERAAIEARVRAGEWLGPPELAALFGKSRATIWRWAVKKHWLAYEQDDSTHEITCEPGSVLALLEALRVMQQAPASKT